MKTCPNCHLSWDDELSFCCECGTALPEAAAAAAALGTAASVAEAAQEKAPEPDVFSAPAADEVFDFGLGAQIAAAKSAEVSHRKKVRAQINVNPKGLIVAGAVLLLVLALAVFLFLFLGGRAGGKESFSEKNSATLKNKADETELCENCGGTLYNGVCDTCAKEEVIGTCEECGEDEQYLRTLEGRRLCEVCYEAQAPNSTDTPEDGEVGVCEICAEEKKLYEHKGARICSDCRELYDHCTKCGTFAEIFLWEGQKLCRDCRFEGYENCYGCGSFLIPYAEGLCESCYNDRYRCDRCGSYGNDYYYNGQDLCWSCYDSVSNVCDRCGGYNSDHYNYNGQDLCWSCYDSVSNVCDRCGGYGNDYYHNGQDLCWSCYDSISSVCDRCGGYNSDHYRHNGQDLCWTCYDYLIWGDGTCFSCGIYGDVTEINGKYYCDSCAP